jgi:tRNA 2-thiouridine synthesizing protein A
MTWFGRRGGSTASGGSVASGGAIPPRPPLRTGGSVAPGGAIPPRPPLRTGGLSAPPYPPDPPEPVLTIDALGRKCPIPIIMLAEQIRDVPVGAIIAVLADDPAAYSDVPAWCGMKSHECVFRSELRSGWAFGIRRRY